MDLIDRQAAIDIVRFECGEWRGLAKTIENGLNDLPSAQPERKTGKWIYKDDLKQYFCNKCGYPSLTYDDMYIYGMDLPNFCEECGADMRGDENE